MKTSLTLTFPTLAAIALTRGMLGAGIGMLASAHVPAHRRRQIGGVLIAIGLLSTAPLIRRVLQGSRDNEPRQMALRSSR
jgi:hypothetical protein